MSSERRRTITNTQAGRRAWRHVWQLIESNTDNVFGGADEEHEPGDEAMTEADRIAVGKHLDKLAQMAFNRSEGPL